MKGTLVTLLLLISLNLFGQKHSFKEISIGLGSGYPGILKLDEITDDSNFTFEREALPPINIWAETNIARRWSAGIYFGYEYEGKSGTVIGFSGSNKALIAGGTIYWYINRRFSEKPTVFNPFVGALFTYSDIDTDTPIRGFIPSFALGLDVVFHKNWLSRLKFGYGSAIAEISFAYRLRISSNNENLK